MNIIPSPIKVTQLACNIFRILNPRNVSSFRSFSSLNAGAPAIFNLSHFLKPTSCSVVPVNNFQTRVHVRKQCPHCYYMWRESRKYVYCKKHPSHNQQTKIPKDKERFIITHKTHGRIRPW